MVVREAHQGELDYFRETVSYEPLEIKRQYRQLEQRVEFFQPTPSFIDDTLAMTRSKKIDWADLLLRREMLVYYAHPHHGMPSYKVIGDAAEQVTRFINRVWGDIVIELPRVDEKAA